MKINWKLRMKNKTTLMALAAAVLSLVYIVLDVCDIAPDITQSQVMEWVAAVLNVLALVGVITDPTTEGISDSERALHYTEPAPCAGKSGEKAPPEP